MKLLVIVVTYNAMQWAERCFDSLKASSIENDVFVVDNGSSDGTQDFIKKNYPSVIFKQSETNLGFGKANNIGLQYALENNYDYVYLLNQDAWVMPDTFEILISIQICHPEYGVLSPMQLEANCVRFDKIFGLVCSMQHHHDFLNDLYFNRLKDVYSVDDVMAAHWLISKACLEKVGGFSPTFPHYGEDNNFNHRVYFKGMKVGIVPGARAIHDRESRKISREKNIYMFYINWLIKLSNPNISTKHNVIHILKESIYKSYYSHSFTPIKYGFQIIKSMIKISKNKCISINNNCAFLY